MKINIIRDYLLYLTKNCNLSVTLHPMRDETLITDSFLMNFNIHDNPYCSYIKSLPGGHAHCLAQQKKVMNRCLREKNGFCGACYAGVVEYVYPLSDGDDVIGFVSVNGYACDECDRCISSVSEQYSCSVDSVKREYRKLKAKIPPKKEVDTLILPLCKMLELAYMKQPQCARDTSLIGEIRRYVQRNYASDVTEDLLCERFSCSKSYFSHGFKKNTGKTFRQYLTDLRIDHAKQLLERSSLTVTQIAFSVGFNDSNYFSNVFKSRVGVSPRKYRKNK